MQTIWKFQLEIADQQYVRMPKGAEILRVGSQEIHGLLEPCIWAQVDDNAETELEDVLIFIRGTGHPLPAYVKYLGSADCPPFVWHIFGEIA